MVFLKGARAGRCGATQAGPSTGATPAVPAGSEIKIPPAPAVGPSAAAAADAGDGAGGDEEEEWATTHAWGGAEGGGVTAGKRGGTEVWAVLGEVVDDALLEITRSSENAQNPLALLHQKYTISTPAAAHPSIGSRAACDVRGGVGGRVDLEFGFACFRATEAREREPRFSCERALRAASGHTVFAAADSGGVLRRVFSP